MSARHRPHGLRLLLLTQYYPPEIGAAQTRLRETVAGLRARGYRVTVMTPVPSYPLGLVHPGYQWWRPARERLDGADVIRLPTLAIPGARISRRIAGQMAFAGLAMSAAALADRHDVALVESPPLLLGVTARALRLAGLPYLFHVADPWPDFPIAMGYLRSRPARQLAFAVEDLSYRGAAAITTVSPGLVDLLNAKPSAHGRVHLLSNGVDLARFRPSVTPAEGRREMGWPDLFTIVYFGTVGLAQGIGTLLDAVARVQVPVAIRVIGEGVEKAELQARAAAMNLTSLSFHGAMAPAEAPRVLAGADAGLVLLRAGPLYEQSLPTKLLETMAAGRPVIVSANGLAVDIVRDAGAGYMAAAEDPADLARAIERCWHDPDRAGIGVAARAAAAADYGREAILDRLDGLLRQAARQPARPADRS